MNCTLHIISLSSYLTLEENDVFRMSFVSDIFVHVFLGTCSSEESAKAKTQKELLKTLKELKRHLPPEKRNKGSKSTTLNTLKYALRCVRHVEGEQYIEV